MFDVQHLDIVVVDFEWTDKNYKTEIVYAVNDDKTEWSLSPK